MVPQNYNHNVTEITSNMIYIVAFGVGLKCTRKIHLSTQCPPDPGSDGSTIYGDKMRGDGVKKCLFLSTLRI